MLSEKLIMEEKIKAICKKDRTIFQKGAVFDKITVLNSDPCGSMLCGPVTFLGCTDRYEMLFASGNGRYYFTVRDGWGVEDNCLYALSIGAIRRDFKKPVTVEEIESGVNNPKEPRGTYSALAIGMKLKDDKEILKVLKQYMELEDKYLNEFYDEKHADTFDYNKPFVYKFKYIYKDGTEYEWDTVFSCFDALYLTSNVIFFGTLSTNFEFVCTKFFPFLFC